MLKKLSQILEVDESSAAREKRKHASGWSIRDIASNNCQSLQRTAKMTKIILGRRYWSILHDASFLNSKMQIPNQRVKRVVHYLFSEDGLNCGYITRRYLMGELDDSQLRTMGRIGQIIINSASLEMTAQELEIALSNDGMDLPLAEGQSPASALPTEQQ